MIPLRVVPALLMGGIMYYMVGLTPAIENFMKFLLVLVLFNLTTASNCLVVGAASQSMGLSILASVLIIILSILFGGLFQNSGTIQHGDGVC
jgi:ABC-type multidrug transport system permease subunit